MPRARIPTTGEPSLGLEEEVSFSSHEDLIDDLGEIAIPLKSSDGSGGAPPVPSLSLSSSTSASGQPHGFTSGEDHTKQSKKFGLFSKKTRQTLDETAALGRGESKRNLLLASGLGDGDLLTPKERVREAAKREKAALVLPDELQVAVDHHDKEKVTGRWRAKLAGKNKREGGGAGKEGLFKTDSRTSGTSHGCQSSDTS